MFLILQGDMITTLMEQVGTVVMLYTHIWEVVASNLGQGIILSEDFHHFPQSL
jgi:hypothetical protein